MSYNDITEITKLLAIAIENCVFAPTPTEGHDENCKVCSYIKKGINKLKEAYDKQDY